MVFERFDTIEYIEVKCDTFSDFCVRNATDIFIY